MDSYGKAVIVGTDGDLEHGHAIAHPKLGQLFREFLGGKEHAKAVIPSTAKLGVTGTSIDIPLMFRKSVWVVSHADTMTISVPDAPLKDEILIAIGITTGGRPFARVDGLQKEEV